MLESIVAGILSKFLGDYIVGLESENLNLNISGGHVTLENLQIKKECLAELELPLQVKEGFLGKFSLEIPWSSLGSKPAIAVIERVFILIGPSKPSEYNKELVKRKTEETKRRKLQINELLASDPTKEDKKPVVEGNEKLSYTQKLIRTVVDNFQVFIKKVHVRYEDDISNPGHKFVFGMTMESMQVESCDANWNPKFLKPEARKFIHKIGKLTNFLVYSSQSSPFISYSNTKQLSKAMDNFIHTEHHESPILSDCILYPVNSTLKIQLNQKQGDLSAPKLLADLFLDQIIMQLKEHQYHNFLYLGNYFSYYLRGIKYHAHRPDRNVRPRNDPMVWWNFVLKSAISEVKEKRAQRMWRNVSTYSRNRLTYITLYKKKILQKSKMSEVVGTAIVDLEKLLKYEDIVLFRSMTESLIRKQIKDQKLQMDKKGWFGGWFNKKDEDITTMEVISRSDWKYIYNDINFLNEEKDVDLVPPEYVKTKATFSVGEGSFELVGSASDDFGEFIDQKIITAGFEGFQVEFEQRDKGETIKSTVVSVAVVDFFTLRDKDESVDMVSIKDDPHHSDKHINSLFSFQFDRNPLNSPVDMKLALSAKQSLNISFGMPVINRIVKFFNHAAANQLKVTANSTWEGLKSAAEVQVKYALDNRKTIELAIDVVAPTILIPSNFVDPMASLLVVELGHLSFISDPQNRSKSITLNESGDQQVSKDFFYDKFLIEMRSIHVMVTDRSSYTAHSITPGESNEAFTDLVEKFNITTHVYVCSVTSSELPKIRISGNLPVISALVSPNKVSHLFSVLRSFSDTNSSPSAPAIEDDHTNIIIIDDSNKIEVQNFHSQDIIRRKPKSSNQKPSALVKPLMNLMELQFKMDDLFLSVHNDSFGEDGDNHFELLKMKMSHFEIGLNVTSYYNKAELSIQSLHVFDQMQSTPENPIYLLSSTPIRNYKGEEFSYDLEHNKLITISYLGIPKTSPEYKSIQHSIDVSFNLLQLQVYRQTMVSLLSYTNNIVALISTPPSTSPPENRVNTNANANASPVDSSIEPEKQTLQVHDSSIMLKANVNVKCLIASLVRDSTTFLEASLKNTNLTASVYTNSDLKVHGGLGIAEINDCSPDTRWSTIITSTSEENQFLSFAFEVETIPAPTSGQAGGTSKEIVLKDATVVQQSKIMNITAKVKMSSVRIIVLAKFLKTLLSYFNEFNDMTKHIALHNSKLKDSAKSLTESTPSPSPSPQPSTKVFVTFDVSIENPQVVIPRSSTDSNYIVLNLGDMKISNAFNNYDEIMMDEIKLKIEALSIYTFNRNMHIRRRDLLEDSNIEISINRVADNNLHHRFPDFSVFMKISEGMTLKLSEIQLQLILETLKNNALELPSPSSDLEKFKALFPELPSSSTSSDITPPKHEAIATAEEDFVKFQFGFSLKLLSMIVFEGDGYIRDYEKHGSEEYESNTILGLIKLSVEGLNTKATITSRSRIAAFLNIDNFAIKDVRPISRNHFRNIFTSICEEKHHHSILSLEYNKDEVGNQIAVLNINSPRILLIPDILLYLQEFGLKKSKEITTALAEFQKSFSMTAPSPNDKSKEIVVAEAKPEVAKAEQEGNLQAKISINNVEVCLLENAEDKDSRLLILKQSLTLNFGMSAKGIINTTMKIQNIQVFKCLLESKDTPIILLSPFDIDISVDIVPQLIKAIESASSQNVNIVEKEIKVNDMTISLGIGAIDCKISYTDFKLLMIIKDHWIVKPQPAIQEADSIEIIDKYKLQPRKQNKDEEKKEIDPTPKVFGKESVSLTLGTVKLLLINDFYEESGGGVSNVPLMELSLQKLDSEVSNWSSKLAGDFFLTQMQILYYNSELHINEPMIEPWNFYASIFKNDQGTFNAKLSNEDVLNINLSKFFVETLFNNLEQWQKDFYDRASLTSSSTTSKLSPYYIVNHTGIPLTYWITGSSKKFRLECDVEVPLDTSELAKIEKHRADFEFMISVQLDDDDFIPVHNIPVVKKINLSFEVIKKSGVFLYYSINFRRGGSKVLTLGSSLLVENSTSQPLQLLATPQDPPTTSDGNVLSKLRLSNKPGNNKSLQRSGKNLNNNHDDDVRAQKKKQLKAIIIDIEPGAKKFIPIKYSTNSLIQMRPSAENLPYHWSQETIKTTVLRRDTVPFTFSCLTVDQEDMEEKPGTAITKSWLYSVDIEGVRSPKGQINNSNIVNDLLFQKKQKNSKLVQLHIHAPLTIENTLPEDLCYRIKSTPNRKSSSTSKLASQGIHLADIKFEGRLACGEKKEIFELLKDKRPNVFFKIDRYNWSSPLKISTSSTMFIPLESADKRTFSLGLESQMRTYGARFFTAFVKYWIYNKTEGTLKYKNMLAINIGSAHSNRGIAGDSQVTRVRRTSEHHSPLSSSETDEISSEQNSVIEEEEIQYIKPFMFTSDKISIRKPTTAWSKAFALTTNGGTVELQRLNEKRAPETTKLDRVSASITSAPGKYYRTSIVTFTPHYLLINSSLFSIDVKQTGCGKYATELLPKMQSYFDWYTSSHPSTIQFRISDSDYEEYDWSIQIPIDAPNSFQIPLWKDETSPPIYVRVSINVTPTGSVTVTFLYQNDHNDYPDYRIENYSSHPIRFHEQKPNSYVYKVDPQYSTPFAWNNPFTPKKHIILNVPHTSLESSISLDKLNTYPIITWVDSRGESQYLSVEVIADGPIKVLVIDDIHPDDLEKYREKSLTPSSSNLKDDVMKDYDSVKYLLNVSLIFNAIGFSIIDKNPQELLYISMRSIKIDAAIVNEIQSLELSLGALQIDNQLFSTIYPILLYSPPIEGQPFFQFSVMKSSKYPKIMYFPYFALKLQKFEITMEEKLLLRMLSFVEVMTSFLSSRRMEEDEAALFATSPSYFLTTSQSETQSSMIYFDIFHLNPLLMNITFSTLGGSSDQNNNNNNYASSIDASGSGGSGGSNQPKAPSVLEKTLRAGGFLANIDHTPLKLNGLILEHPFVSQSQLISRIVQHYTQQVISQLYLILGSSDVLGSPVSLVGSLGTGVYDFFHEPAEGMVHSPAEFAMGVAKGTRSLVKNSVFGVFNSASKITGTISKAATTISLDDDWQRDRAKKMMSKPQHVGQGIQKGLINFSTGVFEGFTGVVSQPLKGLSKEGGVGLVKGVGKGVTGLFLRPVVGVVDLITDTTEGIKNTATYFEDRKRDKVRPPRYIGKDRILQVFDQQKSYHQFILRTIEDCAYENHFFLSCFALPEGKTLILSDLMILVLIIKSRTDIRRKLRVYYGELSGSKAVENGVMLLFPSEKNIQIDVNNQKDAESIAQQITVYSSLLVSRALTSYHDQEDQKMIALFTPQSSKEDISRKIEVIEEDEKIKNEKFDDDGGEDEFVSIDINNVRSPRSLPRGNSSLSATEKEPLVLPPRQSETSKSSAAAKKSSSKSTEKQPLLGSNATISKPQQKRPPPKDSGCCCAIL